MEKTIQNLKNTAIILSVLMFCVGISFAANQTPDLLGQEITNALVRTYK